MTTKTTYKVGDKVRILNAKAISTCAAKDGDILEVVSIDRSNDPVLLDVDEGHLSLFTSELKYIEKVAEQMAKFKVGDKVKVVAASHGWGGVSKGDEGVIARINNNGSYEAKIPSFGDKITWTGAEECFELLSPKPTKNQRIATLEQTVADLQAEVEALKDAQKIAIKAPTMTVKADVDVAKIAESLATRLGEKTALTPNEQRKAIIAEAKAFVEDVTNRMKKYGHGNILGEHGKITTEARGFILRANFVVNPEKRTVVALVIPFYLDDTDIKSKGIAKCAPDDVFNADIGKAIALGRALGLDVSKFEKAVQPDYYAVGHVITFPKDDEWHGKLNYRVDKIADGGSTLTKLFEEGGKANANTACTQYYETDIKSALPIIDDTEAQY